MTRKWTADRDCDGNGMTCTHRAALKRCHTLLQDAGHWIDMDAHAEWHAAMDQELLACDESGECPTVARTQPWTEGELAKAMHAERLEREGCRSNYADERWDESKADRERWYASARVALSRPLAVEGEAVSAKIDPSTRKPTEGEARCPLCHRGIEWSLCSHAFHMKPTAQVWCDSCKRTHAEPWCEKEPTCPRCAKAEALAGAASNLYEMLDESCVNGPEAHALAAALAAFREGK